MDSNLSSVPAVSLLNLDKMSLSDMLVAKQGKASSNWLLATSNVFRRMCDRIEHFVNTQEESSINSDKKKSKLKFRSSSMYNQSSVPVPSGSNSNEMNRKSLKTVHYWAPQNISQTVYTNDLKGFEGTLEFIFPVLTHEIITEAELSLKITHPTRVNEHPFSLYGIAAKIPLQHWKKSNESNKDEMEKALLLSDVRVAPGTQNVVFNVTDFLRMVQRALSEYNTCTDMIHLYFKIKREGNDEDDIINGEDGDESTFNKIGARLGQTCHLILSDSNPFHHFLRLDYTKKKQENNQLLLEIKNNFDTNNNNNRVSRRSIN